MIQGLREAMAAMANLKDSSKQLVRGGKYYATVATRVEIFRQHCNAGIETVLELDDGTKIQMRAIIRTPDGTVVASGYAEEVRSDRGVNSTSALENGETSAIGRALANLGLLGGEYASADELQNALDQQSKPPAPPAAPEKKPAPKSKTTNPEPVEQSEGCPFFDGLADELSRVQSPRALDEWKRNNAVVLQILTDEHPDENKVLRQMFATKQGEIND